MKKIVIAMIMGLVATSYGIVNVNWTASGGFYFVADPATGILGADNSGKSTIAQLMFSPDAIQDAGNGATGIGLNGAGYNGGNDVMWGSLTITADGSAFSGYAVFPATQNEQRSFTSGYVYAMIFQDNALNVNDWYYYTPLMSLQDIVGAGVPQGIEMNLDVANGNAIDDLAQKGITTGQVVPEPATFLLVGIGGIASWIIRRMRLA